MATSYWGNIEQVIEFIRQWHPSTILDIGCGFGKWGLLTREYLDVYDRKSYGDNWQTKIDTIEIWSKMILSHHKSLYDNIYIGNCVDILPKLHSYDLILMMDVLEHLNKDDGHIMLELLLKHGRKIILQVPIGHWPQSPIFGNPFEQHLSTWTKEDFTSLSNLIFFKIKKNIGGKDIALVILNGEQ